MEKALTWSGAVVRAAAAGHRPGVAACSIDLARHPTVAALFEDRPVFWSRLLPMQPLHLVGWGRKTSGKRVAAAKGAAQRHILEDGFLRSVGRRDTALSIVFDDDGIYYDADCDSRFFRLARQQLRPDQVRRAKDLVSRWQALDLSKYNDAPDAKGLPDTPFVLVLDQVRGDLSIGYGRADASSFDRMLTAALAEHPEATVLVKIHPNSLSDPRKRHFDVGKLRAMPRVRVLTTACHVTGLIRAASAIYTVTSQVGFEALLHGKPVRCFGMPFYAGWGLTLDDQEPPAGRHGIPLEQLVHAALVDYPRYADPVIRQEIQAEEAMEAVGLNRRIRLEHPAVVHALGFSRWKRPFIRAFMTGSDVRFARSACRVPEGATLLLWGAQPAPEARDDLRIVRIEDGFLRSVGLGAELIRPMSLAFDDRGIHYDPSRPSRIEEILARGTFTDADRARGTALRFAITAAGVGKYNLGGRVWKRPDTERKVILVAGQVGDDQSVLLGSPLVRSDAELLRAVRAGDPDAWIVYRPHPDVVAGLRKGGIAPDDVAPFDEVAADADLDSLFRGVDEVHVMTSLLGFEALLRGIPVVCHGLPFYAGWGLTRDRIACPRRGRRLALDELVFGALVDYPRYLMPGSSFFVTPERIISELAARAGTPSPGLSMRRRAIRILVQPWRAARTRIGPRPGPASRSAT